MADKTNYLVSHFFVSSDYFLQFESLRDFAFRCGCCSTVLAKVNGKTTFFVCTNKRTLRQNEGRTTSMPLILIEEMKKSRGSCEASYLPTLCANEQNPSRVEGVPSITQADLANQNLDNYKSVKNGLLMKSTRLTSPSMNVIIYRREGLQWIKHR